MRMYTCTHMHMLACICTPEHTFPSSFLLACCLRPSLPLLCLLIHSFLIPGPTCFSIPHLPGCKEVLSSFHFSIPNLQAAEKSRPSPQPTAVPMPESPRKPIPVVKASLNLSAPVIILPTTLRGGLVLDLGNVSLSATPEYNKESTVAALVGHVQLSAAQLYG